MIIVISPAKSLFLEKPIDFNVYTNPYFLADSEKLVSKLKKLSPEKISSLMHISPKLGELNFERYLQWSAPFTLENSWQAILMFNGDVYQGLNAKTFSEEEFTVAQEKLRILSGLYGLLRPLDLIQPYRLEMGTRFSPGNKKDLYDLWKSKITNKLKEELKKDSNPVLINLASNEYFSAIDVKKLNTRIITPAFKDYKNGKYQMISFFAKKARGLMSRFIIENNISDEEAIKTFNTEGYYYNNRLSKGDNWVFTRES